MNQHVQQPTPDTVETGIVERLTQLRAEWSEGQRRMEALDTERAKTRDTLLRIAGAIQVLEELSGADLGEAGRQ
ncbi:hypothetical protein JNB88_13365 [Rhizobium cauense]|uniref:hypothetical protein n=1 Tax=Rhizobium cauense TaxID=1166683 RepID=UPI001C6E81A8|nr:hypothetical protein [Rhizobium cauense]MBW9114635.1 hypothetical protein [Rhizobium cauense]